MRYLATAALSFSAAVFLSEYLLPLELLPVFAICFTAAAVLLILPRRKWLRGFIISFMGLAVGFGYYFAHDYRISSEVGRLDGRMMVFSAKLNGYPDVYEDYCRCEIILQTDGMPEFRCIIYDQGQDLADAKPGDIISCTGKFRSAGIRYGEEYDNYYSKDIYLVINVDNVLRINQVAFDLQTLPLEINHRISGLIDDIFPEDTAHFMKSIMVGDRTDFYEDTSLHKAMTRSGLMHVVAVSGMHTAFLVSLIQLSFGHGRKSSVLCILLIWIFVLVAGAPPSAVRAAVMQTFLLMAAFLRRENDPLTSLSAALAVILLANPYAAASISLQLSFGAMAGIMCFSGRIYDAIYEHIPEGILKRLLDYPVGIASSSIAVMPFTVPLTAIHFGSIQTLAVVSNVLCLFAVSICFCGGFICCALGVICFPAGQFASWILSFAARYIFIAAKAVSTVPFASVYISENIMAVWLAFCYGVGILIIISKYKPWVKLAAVASATIMSLIMTLTVVHHCYRSAEGVITVLDVGQGQCISVISGDSTILIDCGSIGTAQNAGDVAENFLSFSGRDRVDALVLSHLHADHANGVANLLETVDVDRIILPTEPGDDDSLFADILKSALMHGVKIDFISQDCRFEEGSISVQIYAPGDKADTNERCLMCRVSINDYDMFVTGDSSAKAERELISSHDINDVELLIVGHHGSRNSCCDELLKSIGGEDAVISVGYNTYGHPTYETLERVAAYGYNIYRTDLNGDIEFRIG